MSRNVPKFIIIIGEVGSGRYTLAKTIANVLSCTPISVGTSVDEVRAVIENAYTVTDTSVYIFRDADSMKAEAKNALLKVTEEPPNNSYFICTFRTSENVLETLLNRSTVIYMEPYTKREIEAESKVILDVTYIDTIGELKKWEEDGNYEEFINYVDFISRRLPHMYGTEVLKISKKLKCKDTDSGYDVLQFIKTLYLMIGTNEEIARITQKCLQELRLSGINKKSTVDLYLLELRGMLRAKD